jgi:NAD(P)-dependent dehydrogenase (short-subunit alcohol dehydrogenase family)
VTEPVTGPVTQPLASRRALVTGGASGIGAGAVRRLVDEGVHVVLGDLDRAGGDALADEVGATFAQLDVSLPEDWSRVVAEHGPFDIGFLNAGVSTNDERQPDTLPIVGLTDDAYRRIMGANVDGVVFGTRALLPAMIAAGRGDIVATASMAGLTPIPMDPVYGLTKHAVIGFVRSMAAAFERQPGGPDVCVSAICPGFTDTNIISDDAKSFITDLGLEIMTTGHVADVVVRSLTERIQGAQWVVWPGVDVHPYQWAAALPEGTL